MADSIETNAGLASIAFANATKQAQDAQNQLFRSFGVVAPNAGGAYTVEGAQSAFDPTKLYSGGKFDQSLFDRAAADIHVGGTGQLADISRGAATTEADVMSGAMSRGLAGSGLAAQARQGVEEAGISSLQAGKEQLVQGMAQALAPVGSAYETLQRGTAQDLFSGLMSGILGDLWSPTPKKKKK